MKFKTLLLIIPLMVLSFGCTKQKEKFASHTKPVKLTDYLYEVEYTDYAPDMTYKYVKSMENIAKSGACTVTRNGNLIGRNYDYFYSEMAEFVIKVSAAEGRYASIGVATSIFELTPEQAENDPYGQYFDILPYVTMDGVNEKGVYINVNMVNYEDGSPTTGTCPGGEALYMCMPVRYVLDHCATAKEACEALETKNIIFSKIMGEFHFFIADKDESYVVEIRDNKMTWRQPKDNIMANFYVLTDEFLSGNGYGLTYPCGTERYDYVLAHYDELTSKEGVKNVMSGIKYSKTYDLNTNPFWYSEYYARTYNGLTIDINTPHEQYDEYIKETCDAFKNKKRDFLEGMWITTHTSIYDLSDLSLRVFVQENYDQPFDFKLK